jgi:hypothetical protein
MPPCFRIGGLCRRSISKTLSSLSDETARNPSDLPMVEKQAVADDWLRHCF